MLDVPKYSRSPRSGHFPARFLGRANTGDKMMTLVASALAGGDCIDDADALRTGGTACALGSVVKAPSTPRFREGRLWAPSCAASGGAMSANWTG